MFSKMLIANRGEIAVRVIHACRRARHLARRGLFRRRSRCASRANGRRGGPLGPPPARESYLAIDKVIGAAKSTGAEAIHPGYGFLSENADVRPRLRGRRRDVRRPEPRDARALRRQGARASKRSRAPARPSSRASRRSRPAPTRRSAPRIRSGLPLLVKAAAGGGGKGMRVVRKAAELPAALAGAEREALAAFGDGRVFLERYVERPRHVEVQILADAHGNDPPPRRARVLAPAPSPEDRRGGAVRRGRREAPRTTHARRDPGREGRRTTRTPAPSSSCSAPTAKSSSSRSTRASRSSTP